MKPNFTILFTLMLLVCPLASAAIIEVLPGEKTLHQAIAVANDGDTLSLADGVYNEGSSIVVAKHLVIQAAPNATPVLHMNRMTVKKGFTLKGLALDGKRYNATEAIRLDTEKGVDIKIQECSVSNFSNYAVRFYATDSATSFVNSLLIDGCIFSGDMERVLYASALPMQAASVEIKNSTFIALNKQRYFIYLIGGTTLTDGSSVLVDHCTFYNCSDKRGVYLPNVNGAVVKNCIAAYAAPVTDTKSFSLYGSGSLITHTISYQVDMYGSAPRQNVMNRDPLFVDPDNGNFRLYANSPALGAATDGSNLGDPRWGVSDDNAPVGSLPYVPFKKPYSMSPTANSVRIMWQMQDTISKGVVYYGKTEALGDSIVSNDGWLVAEEGFVHVKVLPDLDPATTYYYQVGSGVKRFEEIRQTKTAPAKGSNFRLAIAADFHDNSGKVWEKMVPQVVQQAPDLFIHLGDIINHGDTRPWNSSFFTPSEPLLSRIPMMGAVGNHETGDKPSNGTTTYYDYFSSFSHGYIDDTEEKDPRGESYYATDYGDVKIISLNLNGDASSPALDANSQQMAWLDTQIQNADSKWIFIISHVSVYSTGYHGQWAADKKRSVAPILEKHAANGKHIIFFSGNCHSFEHLYKSGVHYVRPSVAASNIREQFNMADLPYSLIWKSTNGFSTIDVSQDGETVTMISRDENGQEFYSYIFTKTAQMMPSLYFTEPDGNNDVATDMFRIKWSCFDETGNGKIALYHSLDSINGTLIAENLSTNLAEIDYFDWNVRYLEPKGDYFIYGIIDDGITPPIKKYARGKVSVRADTTAPPPPTNFAGYVDEGKVVLNWQNPTRLMDVENRIDDFENGIGSFVGVPHAETATGSLEIAPGYNSAKALKMNYTILIPWGQYSAVLQNSTAQNYAGTPYLEFWFKGDGSSRNLRVMIKQDLDFNGIADDWWYNESLRLSSTDWQKATLDLRTFQELSWHTNVSKAMSPENMYAIEFIVPSGTIGDGTVLIDNIVLTGQIYPAPDYVGTKILRRTDRFPTNHQDGEMVYNGTNETFTDNHTTSGSHYYYAGFTYDDLNNFSDFDTSASWATQITSVKTPLSGKALQVFPTPANHTLYLKHGVGGGSVTIYSIDGVLLKTFVPNETPREVSQLDISELNAGVYILTYSTADDFKTIRFIKN